MESEAEEGPGSVAAEDSGGALSGGFPLLPTFVEASPTLLLSQVIANETSIHLETPSSSSDPDADDDSSRGHKSTNCCTKPTVYCLIITLPVAIPLVIYLRDVDAVRRVSHSIIEPAFVIFIAILFTFSVVFIIRILGEASSSRYWTSSGGHVVHSRPSSSGSREMYSGRNEGPTNYVPRHSPYNLTRTVCVNGSHHLNGHVHHQEQHQRNHPHRLTVHYHLSGRSGSSLNSSIGAAGRRSPRHNSPSLSPVPFRYSRSPSSRRGLRTHRRARTPSPLHLGHGHGSWRGVGLSPVRFTSSTGPSSPFYQRLPTHYHFFASPGEHANGSCPQTEDDPPPSYDKALSCPVFQDKPNGPQIKVDANILALEATGNNSKQDVVLDMSDLLHNDTHNDREEEEEEPPPLYQQCVFD